MSRMITVQIDSDDMIEMLCDRMAEWTKVSFGDEYECYCQYLEELVESGVFDDSEFNVAYIVDNIYVNDTTMITPENFDEYNFDPDDEDQERVLAHVGDYWLLDAYM